jgi:hypothetical protein
LNPLNSLYAERTWCTSGNVRADAERVPRYREQAARYRKFAGDEAVPLARDCLLDMARHLEQLASELESSTRHCAVDQFARIEVH